MNVDSSVYEGMRVKGITKTVLSHGKVVIEYDKYAGQPGDLFLLTAVAPGHWCLFLSTRRVSRPWATLKLMKTEGFQVGYRRLRDEHRIRNDDTTLLEVRVVSNSGSSKRW